MTQPFVSDVDFEARELIRHAAQPIQGANTDYNALMQAIGDAPVVFIGEATHGTHEFYRERARITQQLILEKGFSAIAVEADWPDSYRVNRYVRGNATGESARESTTEALSGFQRFPTWMWRNRDVLSFIEWLHGYNREQAENRRVGFYGLDLYSLFTSINTVIDYLGQVDPNAAEQARQRYACFDRFDQDLQEYGMMSAYGISSSCEDEVVRQLTDLRQHAWEYAHRDGQIAAEAFFNAEMNAHLARNAEQYYRTMFAGRVSSWNLRDTHMFETLNSLINHLSSRQPAHNPAKVVVWAHNSHVGNAAATDMARMGEFNIGQLARQQWQDMAFLIGFSTYTGTVTAASSWDAPAECKRVRPALPNSYETLFHQTGIPQALIILRNDRALSHALRLPRLERAIGVIYQPATERQSHYIYATLPEQFDAIIHWDETRAVEPLERGTLWEQGEVPETYPSTL